MKLASRDHRTSGRELRLGTFCVRNSRKPFNVKCGSKGGMLSITGVVVSRDLSYADVYFTSVSAQQEEDKDEVLRVLQGAAGFLRSVLARRHVMRTTPALRFHYDELIQNGPELEALIDGAVASDQGRDDSYRARKLLMGRSRKGRDVSGVIVLDKPRGMTSSTAVQRFKSLFGARKVGHTGSLDPLATGVLPLCFGEATKFSRFLLTSDKKYWVKLKLGIRTASGDSDAVTLKRGVP
ncbi:MAG: hypothetical protein Ct9H300mP8_06580 [Gammaproteobacteria bacterium]|nr:MAG: hypothetical protein Ct9H300mP8_06580 [Gammaproteobacteria bacterium]